MRRWIRTRLLPFGLATLTTACTLERPEGAFYPVYKDDSPPDFDDLEAGVPVPDAQVGFFEDDAGSKPGTGDKDGGGEPVEDRALSELLGAYWVRIDDYSRAEAEASRPPLTVNIAVRTRVSYMGVAYIEEVGGELVSRERICQQTYAHTCSEGCVNGATKTVVDPRALSKLSEVSPTVRGLTLDRANGLLSGETHAFPLGYDGTADPSLPGSTGDTRLWDPDPQAGREGFYTQAVAQVKSLGLTRTADCRLSVALRFVNNWSVKLKQSGEAFVLHEVSSDVGGQLDLSATERKVLDAKGYQDSTDADCMGESATGSNETPVRKSIRFVKVDTSAIHTCPSVAMYDSRLPAEAP